MKSIFGSKLRFGQLTAVMRAGDRLVRRDAISFLRDQLPFWKQMWDPLAPLKNDSVTDHFVKISQGISILKERSNMDRIRLLFHKVLQYQYYVRIVKEVEESNIKKRCGVGNASYATDMLLERLHADDWGRIDDSEKLRRKGCLHKKSHLGKWLTILSGFLGLGILLLSSPKAMMIINDNEFSDDQVIALVCYATNAFPELPRLGKALDGVVRHMVKNLGLVEISLQRQTLELKKEALGNDHPDTLNSIYNLALVFEQQGKYAEAEKLQQKRI